MHQPTSNLTAAAYEFNPFQFERNNGSSQKQNIGIAELFKHSKFGDFELSTFI